MTSPPNTKLFTIIDPESIHNQERHFPPPHKRKLYQLNHPASGQHDLNFLSYSPAKD